MENASRDLLMTAGLLIGIIIVSLGIYLVTISRDFSETYDETISGQKMQEFNAPFVSLSGRKNVSPHEILTLANKANTFNNPDTALAGYYNNGKLNPTDSQYIHVYVKFENKSDAYSFDLTVKDDDIIKYGNYCRNSAYRSNRDSFVNRFLDGSYVYDLYNKSLQKFGQYEFDYIESADGRKRRIYYNCYECTDVNINHNTGRVESITFLFKQSNS